MVSAEAGANSATRRKCAQMRLKPRSRTVYAPAQMPTKKKAPKEEIEDVPEDLAELGDDDLDEDVLGDEDDLVVEDDIDDDDDALVEVEIEEIDELLVAEPAAVIEPLQREERRRRRR